MNLFDFYIPEWFFVAANLLILALVLKKFLWKPVMGVLDARQEAAVKTEKDAEEAARLLAEAQTVRERLDAELESKAAEFMKEARVKAGREYDRIVSEAESRADMILSAAAKKADQERERMLIDVQKQVAAAVLDIAGTLIHSNMDDEKNRRLVDDMLKDSFV